MEELRHFKLEDLYERLLNWSDETFCEWLQHLKLLHSKRTCECGSKITLKQKSDRNQGIWRCPKKCGKMKGYAAGTFFEGLHLHQRSNYL
uniref:Transposase zinc-ribbon domain-containing protein n=1 Tax=Ditylenchus dipsaci TaxID=166011 RepID=A0A915DMM1_9BILA